MERSSWFRSAQLRYDVGWLEQPTPHRLTSRTADLIVNPFEIHVSSDLLSTDLPLTPLRRVLIF